MRRWIVIVVAVAACRGGSDRRAPAPAPRPPPADPCAQTDPRPCLALAHDVEDGTHGDKDVARARMLYGRLCDREVGEACLALAWSYQRDDQPDEPRAAELTRRACDLGYALGCTQAGDADLTHRDALYRKALAIALARCRAGAAASCFEAHGIADAHHIADDVSAADWVTLHARAHVGCALHDALACSALARLASEGLGQPADADAARVFSAKACDAGDAQSCRDLADRARREHDEPGAAALVQRGCELGDALACWQLAETVTTSDPARALALDERACELGDTAGCSRAAQMLDRGTGTAVDHATADTFRDRLCGRGVADACIALAQYDRACTIGDVSRGCAHVAAQLAPACKAGDPRACRALDTLLGSLRAASRDLAASACCRDRAGVGTSPVLAVLDRMKGAMPFSASSLRCPDTFDQNGEATCTVFEGGFSASYTVTNIDGHMRVTAVDEQAH